MNAHITDGTLLIDIDNFYKYFYFSDKYDLRYSYTYEYNSEGIIDTIVLERI